MSLFVAMPVIAAERLVVVELFTSQGCSSCPPADALLGEIATREGILALALHVDYWDYIGWKDEFASPAHTERQKSYARQNAQKSVYTPQMIVGGRDFVIGYKPMKLADLIEKHRNATPEATITLNRRGDAVDIVVDGMRKQVPVNVYVVTYSGKRIVNVLRGENAGRTLAYHNVVTGWNNVGGWNGSGTFRASAKIGEGSNHAVIVQERGPGRVLAAARVR